MKEKHTGQTLSKSKERTNWEQLRSRSDRQIRRGIEMDPDARATDTAFWKKAHVVIPESKANHYDTARCGPSRVAASAEGLSDQN
jgi:hypothetical protein